jgi:hypothetical protein
VSTSKKKIAKPTTAPLRIVVLQRGWVVLGRVRRTTGDEIEITDASTIRRWGTTAGLGQLASQGKQPNTVLDACPTVRVHPLAIVQQIDCVEAAWSPR